VGGDRDSLRLDREDEATIHAVAAANPRTVVVVVAGASVLMEDWRQNVPAIMMAWYSGMEGGNALADVLLGRSEPGGRLPCVFPRNESDLPPFDRNATSVVYDRWYGQRLLNRDGKAAAYPLGFGLSYTTFTISDVKVDLHAETLHVQATVENSGNRPGSHLVQVYATRSESVERFLVGFARTDVVPSERATVRIEVPLERLARWRGPGRWQLPAGAYRVDVGAHAADPAAISTVIEM
jgi:beta-glucosidase